MSDVPGVKFHYLEKWRESIDVDGVDIWSLIEPYMNFREYVFQQLSDAGYFDHLVGDLGGDPLRIFDTVGAITGCTVTLGAYVLNSRNVHAQTPSTTNQTGGAGAKRPTTRQTAETAEGGGAPTTPNDNDDQEELVLRDTVYDIALIRRKALDLVNRCLFKGTFKTKLNALCRGGVNVLVAFRFFDTRYKPVSPMELDEKEIEYQTYKWKTGVDFFPQLTHLEKLVEELRELGGTNVTNRMLYG
jgi:hypothetical protein